MISARVSFHHAGINRKALTLDQSSDHADGNDPFKDVPKNIAVPKAMQPVLRKSRMMRNLVLEIEPTKMG